MCMAIILSRELKAKQKSFSLNKGIKQAQGDNQYTSFFFLFGQLFVAI